MRLLRQTESGRGSGVNFIKVLCATFTQSDHESVKIQLSCKYLLTVLGSMSVKAAHRKLMKLTPEGQIEILTFQLL